MLGRVQHNDWVPFSSVRLNFFYIFLSLSSCLLSAPRWVWAWPISQPPQPQIFPQGSDPLGLPDSSHADIGTAQAQAGEATGACPQSRRWNQDSPETGALSSGQNLWPFTRNGKKSYSLHYSTASGTAFMETKLWYASKRLLVRLDCSVRKNNITSSQEESFVIICSCWRIKINYSGKQFVFWPSLQPELCLYWITDNNSWPEETSQRRIPLSAFQMEVQILQHLPQQTAHHASFSGLQRAVQAKGSSLPSAGCGQQCQLLFL